MSKKQEIDGEAFDYLGESLAVDMLDPATPIATVEAYLREHGADPGQLRREATEFVGELMEKRRLAWQDRARRLIAKRAPLLERVARVAAMTRDEILLRLDQLRSDGRVRAAFRNRRPEESSLDELRALLGEVELVRDIEADKDDE